jgi:type I restriction enzyme, S subunit
MPDRIVSFSELGAESLIEVGAGRPRSVLDQYPSLPVLRVADVLDGRIESPARDRTAGDYREIIGSKVSKPGDIVLTVKGTVGRVALMPSEGLVFAYSPQLCYFRPAASGPLRSRYLYYWFKSAEFWNQADALKGQTDMADYLSLSDIEALKIRIPSLGRQDRIIEVLGAVDDKIAVNDRIASAVDDLASVLLDEVLLDSSNLSSVMLGGIAAVNRRKVSPSAGGILRYIDISSVSVGSVEWPEAASWDDAPGRARRGVSRGDIIWSTVRPNRRSFAIILDDDPQLVVSTGFAVLTPVKVGAAFLYEVTKRDEFVQYLESVAEGSAYPAVRAERFEQAVVPVPSHDRLQKFESVAMPLRERAHAAAVESRSLAELRDTLLPKLMSGEIRVRDAEKVVEDVVLWRAGCRRRSGKTSSWSGSRSLGGSPRTARPLPRGPANVNPGMS